MSPARRWTVAAAGRNLRPSPPAFSLSGAREPRFFLRASGSKCDVNVVFDPSFISSGR